MTKEQARAAAHVMQAWADGKEVECKYPYGWDRVDEPNWDWNRLEYRIKPTAKLRPWTADEVPLGAFMRSKEHGWKSLILEITSDGFIVINKSRARIAINDGFSPEFALQQFEHSTDGGKTWLPCGVVEEVK